MACADWPTHTGLQAHAPGLTPYPLVLAYAHWPAQRLPGLAARFQSNVMRELLCPLHEQLYAAKGNADSALPYIKLRLKTATLYIYAVKRRHGSYVIF